MYDVVFGQFLFLLWSCYAAVCKQREFSSSTVASKIVFLWEFLSVICLLSLWERLLMEYGFWRLWASAQFSEPPGCFTTIISFSVQSGINFSQKLDLANHILQNILPNEWQSKNPHPLPSKIEEHIFYIEITQPKQQQQQQ